WLVGGWGHAGVAVRKFDADYGSPGGHEHGHGEEEGEEEEEEEEEGDIRLEMEQTRVDANGAVNLDLGFFRQLTFSAGYADYEHAEVEGSGEIGTLFTNEGWETRAALVNGDVSSGLSGSVGVQAFHTDFTAVGEEAFVPPVETTDFGVFAAQRYDLGGYGFEGGVRYENRDLDPTEGESRSFDAFSLAGGAFVRPFDGAFLGVNLARTERAPTDAELFSDGPHAATESVEIGDPNLDKETAWALEGAFHYDGGGWHVEAGVFYTVFSDFIFLAPTDEVDPEEDLPIFRYLQDDADLWGGELLVERDIAEFGPWTLVGDAALEYVRAETDSLGDVPRIPPFSAIVGGGLERDFVDLRAEVEVVSEQDRTASFELPTDGYTFVNLSATARPLPDPNVKLIIELLNATDEEGRLHTSQLKDVVPLPGRSVRFAVSARF
ncbi:MAG: TonB-dependent receptor, partial [Caulobacterales bacterium]|nr:TonB-dependent receptor [Caulobacterales bacterium]